MGLFLLGHMIAVTPKKTGTSSLFSRTYFSIRLMWFYDSCANVISALVAEYVISQEHPLTYAYCI